MIATSTPPNFLVAQQQLKQVCKILLSRVYLDGVAGIRDILIDSALIKGTFVGSDRKILDFTINLLFNDVSYKASASQRSDAWLDSYTSTIREDAKKKKSQCTVGISCGNTCISRRKTCEIKLGAIASPKEITKLKELATLARPISGSQVSRDYNAMSIRELQKEARDRGVYKANHQSKEQLKATLSLLDKDPESQEQIRTNIQKQRDRQRAFSKSGSNTINELGKLWKQIGKIQKSAGAGNSEGAAILTAALLMGVTSTVANKVRNQYKDGLNDSADMAMDRATRIPIDNTNKPNIMFAVGGFSGIGSSGQRMKEILESPTDRTKGESWFGKDNHIVPFDHKEFNIPPPTVSKRNPDGSYNPAYLGYVAKEGFGRFLGNYRRGRNEAAVDLAAQMYAYGDRYKKSPINVVGHGTGGNTVREAVEILTRMKPKDGKGLYGSEVAKRLNIANLGTPYFGFTNDKGWKSLNFRTITSAADPFSALPKKAAQWISSVKGHEIDDYLKDGEVRERLRETFNYYSSSLLGQRQNEAKSRQTRTAVGEALSIVNPAAGKLWNQVNKIADYSKENPEAAAILAGALAVGTGTATYVKLRHDYKKGIPESARQAESMIDIEMQKARRDNVKHSNITFTVGGVGASSQELQENLPPELQKTHFVSFDDEISAKENEELQKQGNLNESDYNSQILTKGYGGILKRTLRGVRVPGLGKPEVRNPDAVRLASQLYAYGNTRYTQNQQGPRHVPINVLAAGTGGLTAREAIEILQEMKPNGPKIAKNIRMATLGTPNFGLSGEISQEQNIMGANDPIGRLPRKRSPKSVTASGVKDHRGATYLQNERVQKELVRHFTRPKTESQQKTERSSPPPPRSSPPPPRSEPETTPNIVEEMLGQTTAETKPKKTKKKPQKPPNIPDFTPTSTVEIGEDIPPPAPRKRRKSSPKKPPA